MRVLRFLFYTGFYVAFVCASALLGFVFYMLIANFGALTNEIFQ